MPEILYHYTSMATLKAILEDIKEDKITFRATQIEYLNDSSEYKLGIGVTSELFKDYEEKGLDTGNKKLSEKLTAKHYSFLQNPLWSSLPFIASFSKNRDSLPMWTTYAERGMGVAIGIEMIEPEELKSLKETTQPVWWNCIYSLKEFKQKIESATFKLYEGIKIIDNKVSFPLLSDFGEVMAMLKHKAFIYEKEVRLINQVDKKSEHIRYNESNGLLKPYIKYQFHKSVIKEVRIGPCADRELSEASLNSFLVKFGYQTKQPGKPNYVNVSTSNVPYRNI